MSVEHNGKTYTVDDIERLDGIRQRLSGLVHELRNEKAEMECPHSRGDSFRKKGTTWVVLRVTMSLIAPWSVDLTDFTPAKGLGRGTISVYPDWFDDAKAAGPIDIG